MRKRRPQHGSLARAGVVAAVSAALRAVCPDNVSPPGGLDYYIYLPSRPSELTPGVTGRDPVL